MVTTSGAAMIGIGPAVRPNLSPNADVPHAWAAPTSGPPVSLFR